MNRILKIFFVVLIAAQIRAADNSLIELITGKTEAKSYRLRINAIHKLDRHLSAKNINQLYNFLDSYFTNQTDLSLLEFNAVKNDILNVLVRQKNIHRDAERAKGGVGLMVTGGIAPNEEGAVGPGAGKMSTEEEAGKILEKLRS